MRQLTILPLLLLVLALSCNNDDGATNSTPAPAAPTAMDPPPAMEAPALTFPPIDRACATDADCTVASLPKVEDGVCCHGCPSYPAARTWTQQIVRICNEHNARHRASGCPKIHCSDVPDVACLKGECQFKR